eukprot:gnl/TRDRNA2_/TRDRNA2_92658_c1_seq1.p1 gnl/TRDRNA2_/TRDRNA2_92658_c1~~gnl/TRDRNA2_/TRDRNA2_92658_c1_seq1.p1  ORF type:complete len:283 (-),score=33.11 gnl/TRDRNA2_/TRDRNA2_92658_c1_seq1:250-1035(-)
MICDGCDKEQVRGVVMFSCGVPSCDFDLCAACAQKKLNELSGHSNISTLSHYLQQQLPGARVPSAPSGVAASKTEGKLNSENWPEAGARVPSAPSGAAASNSEGKLNSTAPCLPGTGSVGIGQATLAAVGIGQATLRNESKALGTAIKVGNRMPDMGNRRLAAPQRSCSADPVPESRSTEESPTKPCVSFFPRPVPPLTCPLGHDLVRFVTEGQDFICDGCDHQQACGSVMFSCGRPDCDYDLCTVCARRQRLALLNGALE